jgi:hypothetical protein
MRVCQYICANEVQTRNINLQFNINFVTFIFIICVYYAKTSQLSKGMHVCGYIAMTRSSSPRF